MDNNQIEIEESSKGFPYQRLILTITIMLFILFLILSILNIEPKVKDAPDWTFFLLFAGIVLILGIIFSLLVPNTYQIKLINDKILITSKRKTQDIPLTKIIRIEATTNFLNSWLSVHEFYIIEFSESTKFGKTVYFKTKGQSVFKSGQNFGEKLKTDWIRKTHANKKYSAFGR